MPPPQNVGYTFPDAELQDVHDHVTTSVSRPGLVPLPQFSYGGQQALYSATGYGPQQVVYHNEAATYGGQQVVYPHHVQAGFYPHFTAPVVLLSSGSTAAQLNAQAEIFAYQPVHDQLVGAFLHQTTRRYWIVTERLRRWCIWDALHAWKIRTNEDKMYGHSCKRIRDLAVALRKIRKDQQQVEQNLRKRWGHTKAALEQSNAGVFDQAIVDEDFRRRLRHVAFEFSAQTDKYLTQVAEARQELRTHQGCLILHFFLILMKRRQLQACTLRWRDFVVLGRDAGMVALMQMFRNPQGCPAQCWRNLGLSEEELHTQIPGACVSQGFSAASSRIPGNHRAGALLLRSILEGQRHRMCAWALEKLELGATEDDGLIGTGPGHLGVEVSLASESSYVEGSTANTLTGGPWESERVRSWDEAVPRDRDTHRFDFSGTPDKVGKIVTYTHAFEPGSSPAVVEQPLVPQYGRRVVVRSDHGSVEPRQIPTMVLDREDSVPSIPSDPEHLKPRSSGTDIRSASGGPLDTSQGFSESSLDSADWIYTPVEVVSMDRLKSAPQNFREQRI